MPSYPASGGASKNQSAGLRACRFSLSLHTEGARTILALRWGNPIFWLTLEQGANNMKCPHCTVAFYAHWEDKAVGTDREGHWRVSSATCPECGRVSIILKKMATWRNDTGGVQILDKVLESRLVRPKGASRPPCPSQVPDDTRADYLEACLVLADSPKASAALSRRCLQHLLREYAKVKPEDLSCEIQQVLDSRTLPTHIAESLDAVRNIGNFAAHPQKSKSSGEILDVEPAEAEWNLDVLELLFDFYFVEPEKTRQKREALNKKLAEAGKPPMK